MSCEEFSQDLSAYLDGELPPRERAALEAHLRDCPRCRQELASLRAVSRLVASLPAVEPSEEFTRALSREVAARRPRRWLRPIPLFRGDLIPALAVAAVALIVVTTVLIVPSLTGRLRWTRRTVPPTPFETTPKTLAPAPSPAPAPPTGAVRWEAEKGSAPAAAPASAPAESAATERLAEAERDRAAAPPPPSPRGGPLEAPAGPAGTIAELRPVPGEAAAHPAPGPPAAPSETEEPAAAAAAEVAKTAGAPAGAPPTKPAFHTVVLLCSDTRAGQTAFQQALGELSRLSAATGLATVRRMSPEESKRYARFIKSLLDSPDVITYTEMKVPASDVELVKAVFADRAELTFADPATDVEKLRRLLASARAKPRRAPAGRPAGGRRSLGLSDSLRRARDGAEMMEYAGPQCELVDVVIVLKRRPQEGLRRAAPRLNPSPTPTRRRM